MASNHNFYSLRERERTIGLPNIYGKPQGPRDPDDPETYKVRRGKVGGYVDYLSTADLAYCDQVMVPSGYLRERGESCQMVRHHGNGAMLNPPVLRFPRYRS